MARIVGYARTSTRDQEAGLEAQIRDLRAAGCTEIFSEQVSSVGERAEFDRALASLRGGDKLVVTKLDRLVRSRTSLWDIIDGLEAIEGGGASLRILSLGGETVDTHSATGRLILAMFSAISAWERETMLERQAEGIAKGQADGNYRGRPRAKVIEGAAVRALVASGKMVPQIAAEAGISASAVYRAMARA